MEGTKLGKYEIRGVLGRGAMGTVYEAWDPAIERKVAIKTVNLPASNDAEAKAMFDRFKREAQAAGRLNHPNIVEVFDYGEGDGFAYIVMEFVEGRSLKSIIDSGAQLPLSDVLRVIEDLLTGLQSSHEHGVIHRDIKPANIMLTPDGRAKIADFGVARIENSVMTQAGTIIGTPGYMSPEQLTGQTVDPRSDIYSAGVVLYQLLAGERPFEGNLASMMHKVLNTRPPKPSDLSVIAPPALDAVVERAMARRPEDRYPEAAAFAAALRQAMQAGSRLPTELTRDLPMEEDATVIAPRRGTTAADTAPASPARRSFPPVLVGVALFAALLAGVGGWLVLGQHGPAATTSKVAQDPLSLPPTTPPELPLVTRPPPVPLLAEKAAPQGPPPSSDRAPDAALPPQKSPEPSLEPDLQTSATQTPQPPQPSAPTERAVEPVTDQAPPVSLPARDEHVATPTQLAIVVPPPAELRRAVRDAIAPIPCTLAWGDVTRDGYALELRGILAANSEASLRTAVTAAVPTLPIDWHVETFSEPYCSALELIRPLVAKFGMLNSGLTLSTQDGRTHLWEGDHIILRITAPNYRSRVQLDDVQSDGSVYHMQPSDGYPASQYDPQSQHTWGDARPGVVDPPVVAAPFGTNLIIAIASEKPFFVERRPPIEKVDDYLRSLRSAIEAAQTRNEVITATALILSTSKRP